MDWKKELADPLKKDVLAELGADVTLEVTTQSTRSASGKKIASVTETHTGVAVMGGYATEAEMKDSPLIKAGDTKLITQFDDLDFEPDGKLDEKMTFGGIRYTVADAKKVNPDGKCNIVWIVYVRRVN